jgi:hypothetical protein
VCRPRFFHLASRLLCATIVAGVLGIPAPSAQAAENFIDSAEWRNVSGFPDKYKVYYRGHMTKSNSMNAFQLSVQFYYVKPDGTLEEPADSMTTGAIDSNNTNRLNYGYAYSMGIKSDTSGWKCKTLGKVDQMVGGTVEVWSAAITPN